MITNEFIQSVRKLKRWTPAEKKSIFSYSSARFYYFQPQFDTEFKKKTIKHDSKCCGIWNHFTIVVLSKKWSRFWARPNSRFQKFEARSKSQMILATIVVSCELREYILTQGFILYMFISSP